MSTALPKIKAEDLLFYIAYGVFLVFGILSTSFYYQYFSPVYSLIKYACVAMLLLRELMIHKYNIKSLLIGGLFVVLIVITRSQSSLATITYILIFLFCARNVDFKGIVRFSAWVSLAVVLFVIVSSYLGIIQNYVYYGSSRVRSYLGFRYSLYGPAFLFNITGLFIYLKKDKIRWFTLIALAVFNCWMFMMTGSRLSFVLSVLMILAAGFMKLFPKFFENKKLLCLVMVLSFVVCFGVSMYFTVRYDESVPWQKQLNATLEGRLSLGQSAIEEYGINLFGSEIKLVGNGLDQYGEQNTEDEYNFVDSFYVQILLRYGILFTIIWIILLTYTLYHFCKKGDYWLLLCMTVIAVHCVFDNLSLDLSYNTFWFAVAMVIPSFSNLRDSVCVNR